MDLWRTLEQEAPVFVWPVKFCLAVTLTTYVLSLLTGNVSQVDRVWTALPTIYTIYYALLPLWPRAPPTFFFPYTPEPVHESVSGTYSPRALLMMVLVITWTCRLSYNTWRRGLFNLQDEDYRWEILRQKIPPWLFQIFNLTFIAITQNIILFLLGVPAQIAATQPHALLSTSDYVLGALGFLTIFVEFIADNQQYSYQTFKRSGKLDPNDWPGARIAWTKRDVERGFVTKGLWAWSRHPNFLCEQSFWIIINLIPLVPSGALAVLVTSTSLTSLAPLLPCLVLCTLFFSSTQFTESISLSKYPVAYRAYQQRVGMFVPLLTPVWGAWLSLQGKKEEVDELVYGQGADKGKKVQ
ncbi:hypothetical protein PAXRUDRAFT_834456 [Paxillus rubicundulus Ve08.2h10]|uniref:DUF1295-domain-containing protein n=1 Tax=Paxillus rubicundulus Ve08.2h10 TaxID=930991 RepID=A0A0D0DDF9_9AGAM|nr:hypothetical protein PAXRUDRAFT_834456 [Paxillus rubicundulus Ve08.2h10]